MSSPIQIQFTPPAKDAPGFLRRQKRALQFHQLLAGMQSGHTPRPDDVDNMVEFLADYVTAPAERSAAVEALWEASEEQYEQMLQAISGVTAEVPLESSDKSDASSAMPATRSPATSSSSRRRKRGGKTRRT